jgi:hypothetical protein
MNGFGIETMYVYYIAIEIYIFGCTQLFFHLSIVYA